jgi:hypothetical protein
MPVYHAGGSYRRKSHLHVPDPTDPATPAHRQILLRLRDGRLVLPLAVEPHAQRERETRAPRPGEPEEHAQLVWGALPL